MSRQNLPDKPAGPASALNFLTAWLYLFFAGLICAVLLALTFNVLINGWTIWDNFQYMNLGRALFEGRGCVQLDVPGHPPENLLAPGFPFVLSIIMHLTGYARPILWMKLFVCICYWLSIVMTVWIFVRYFRINRWIALFLAAYLATNVSTTIYATKILTHSPYILFSTLALWALLSYAQNKKINRFVLGIVFTAIAIYMRFPGLPLVVAGSAWLIYCREYKKALIYAGFVFVLAGLWAAPLLLSDNLVYARQLTEAGIDYPPKIHASLLHRYFNHLLDYIFYKIPGLFFPDIGIWPGKWAGAVLKILISMLIWIEIATRIKKRTIGIVEFYVIIYLLMISLAASSWSRYVSYLLPWILLIMLLGLRRIIAMLGLGHNYKFLAGFLPLVILFSFTLPSYIQNVRFTAFHRKQAVHSGLRPDEILLMDGLHGVKKFNVFGAYNWCRANLPHDAIIMTCFLTCVSNFYAERPMVLLPWWWCKFKFNHPKAILPESNEWLWREVLKTDVSHVVLDMDNTRDCEKYMVNALNAFPDCFKPIFKFGNPVSAIVFEIDRPLLWQTLEARGVEDMPPL